MARLTNPKIWLRDRMRSIAVAATTPPLEQHGRELDDLRQRTGALEDQLALVNVLRTRQAADLDELRAELAQVQVRLDEHAQRADRYDETLHAIRAGAGRDREAVLNELLAVTRRMNIIDDATHQPHASAPEPPAGDPR
ncbi:MAG: hypothetical protein JWQ19_2424 [Subtercola sp.]|nr:hypothetical protein [Subtercola sp.]